MKAALQHQVCVKGSLKDPSSEVSVLPDQAADHLVNLDMSISRQVRRGKGRESATQSISQSPSKEFMHS